MALLSHLLLVIQENYSQENYAQIYQRTLTKLSGSLSQRTKSLLLSPIDGIESMILAHAIAGVDIESPAYLEGIETAVEAVANHI